MQSTSATSAVPPAQTVSRTGRRGFLLVLVGAVLWGTNGVSGVLIVENSGTSFAAVVTVRLLLGGGSMLLIALLAGRFRGVPNTAATWRTIAVTAVLTMLVIAAYFQSLAYLGVAISTVASLAVGIITVTVWSALRDRRLPSVVTCCGQVASLVGLVLVCLPGSGSGSATGAADYWLGLGLATVSGVAFAATTHLNSRPQPGLNAQVLVAASLTGAGALCLPWGVFSGFHFGTLSPVAWAALAFLTFVATVLGYLAYYSGLHEGVHPSTVAVCTLLEPVVAGVLALVLLHERFGWTAAVGAGLIMLAVVLARPGASHPEPAVPGP
ncbi:DMT family transporter [Kineococcus sp. SYSU DK004]|uniref:DMT family transporter n=1 Tax=Kineococcus sp. SYSU DK004 TaxID=3383125 RepID=UPI003D7CC89E